MADKHVTINDVARRAGLSVATVSRVMHDNPRVSLDARRRVREAVDTLGYTPNALARGLAMRSTSHTIGVLVTSIGDLFWAEVVRGIEDYVYEQSYAVLIAGAYEDPERERRAIDLFHHKRVDGIIIGASSGGPEALNGRGSFRLPVVFVNNEHVGAGDTAREAEAADHVAVTAAMDRQHAPTLLVTNDDVHGAMLATNHMLQLGHRRIAYLGSGERASSLHRLSGYRRALEGAGVPVDDEIIALAGEGANSGELAAFRLLSHRPAPTALFCYDDMTALGALRAIRACQLHVPRDISLVGFDDIPLAAYLDPPLTTVRQPMYEMGRQAAGMLIGVLRDGDPPRAVTMAGELMVRSSTGPPPA